MNDFVQHVGTYKREARKIARRNIYAKVLGHTKRGSQHNNDPFRAERQSPDFSNYSSDMFRRFLKDSKRDWKEARLDTESEARLIHILNRVKPKRFDRVEAEFFYTEG